MNPSPLIDLRPEPTAALNAGRSVVALESTLIAHGLPWPLNLETARAAEEAVREEGAVPATIAVLHGRPTVGLHEAELEELARSSGILKASRRDLATAVAQQRTAATTVAGTLVLAHQVGIRIMATGGIGGAHRGEHPWDISADVVELARTPVAVVCAGAKSILDLPRTLEVLETHGVPVVGYRTDEFPAFYLSSSGNPVSARVNTPEEAAALIRAHWALQGAGMVLAQPVQTEVVLDSTELEDALDKAENEAVDAGIRGKELTPFLLSRLHEVTEGRTLLINKALVVANARLAAQVGKALGS